MRIHGVVIMKGNNNTTEPIKVRQSQKIVKKESPYHKWQRWDEAGFIAIDLSLQFRLFPVFCKVKIRNRLGCYIL